MHAASAITSIMAMSYPFQQQISAMADSNPTPPSYKRICLLVQADYEKCSDLVVHYLKSPEAAHSVETLIVDPIRHTRSYLDTYPDHVLNDQDYHLVVRYIHSLGVNEDTKFKMLGSVAARNKRPGDITSFPPKIRNMFIGWPSPPFYEATIAILLISLCPNMTHLHFNPGSLTSTTLLAQYLIQNNYGALPTPSLQKLTTVHMEAVGHGIIDNRFYGTINTLYSLRYIHRLPSLTTITMQALADYKAEECTFAPGSSVPSLNHLHLRHCALTGPMVSSIMCMPQTLTHFSWSNAGLWNLEMENTNVFPKTVGKCLWEHRASLQFLDLDTRLYVPSSEDALERWPGLEHRREEYLFHDGGWRGRGRWRGRLFGGIVIEEHERFVGLDRGFSNKGKGEGELPLFAVDLPDEGHGKYAPGSIGSLRGFEVLTHLSVRIGNLLGYDDTEAHEEPPVPTVKYRLVDALPPNLEFLKLYGHEQGKVAEVDAHVDELLERRAEMLPKLKVIEGVDECILGVAGTYEDIPEFGMTWQRPKADLEWVEV